jgi:hypothetical protein
MDSALTLAGLAGMVALTWKVIDFLRLLVNASTNRSGILTQLLAWAGAVLVVFLYGASDLAGSVDVPGIGLLDAVDSPTKVLLGLALGSTASTLVDFRRALDNTDTARVPALLQPASTPGAFPAG